MEPELRYSLTLGTSLVLAAPSLLACLRGDVELATALQWYAVALVAAAIAVGLFDKLITAFAHANLRSRLAEIQPDDEPRRMVPTDDAAPDASA